MTKYKSKQSALRNGEQFYYGMECAKCGSRKRYAKNAHCVSCSVERARKSRKINSKEAERKAIEKERAEIILAHRMNPQLSCRRWA